MSFEDDNKPGRGAYTPPTDDDLPFRRNSYDPRSGRNVGSGGSKAPPVTLIVSAVVLLLLIVAVIFFYRSGMRASTPCEKGGTSKALVRRGRCREGDPGRRGGCIRRRRRRPRRRPPGPPR